MADGTPAAEWRVKGEPDPHAGRYDGERSELCMGFLSDDALANEAFLNYDYRPTPHQLIAGTHHMPIAYMTAVKERIRWLSRKLIEAEAKLAAPGVTVVDEAERLRQVMRDAIYHLRDTRSGYVTRAIEALEAQVGTGGVMPPAGAPERFHCAREGSCDVTPRCTVQCSACAAHGVAGTRKCLYCERDMITGSECTSASQSTDCAMRAGASGVALPDGAKNG